ncbi:MAG: ABC transporter ATP-binding protein [Bacilli bacterium]|nr:ABC transporter ATP-binding protein [Bacilli bacterium]
MLKINNFSKTYGNSGKKAVDNLSINVKKGEIYGFIGHNGAGKTTTIKAIVGINEFEEGEILIDGISIKEDPILCKEKIAYIPDNPDIYTSLTGIGYLNFIADIYQVSKDEREKLINKYATEFEITANLGDLISSYSHGMKQKLVIISALIHKPSLLVLDEPFVGLDPNASFKLKEIMKDLCKKGSSIFFSSHVLEVVEKLCDNVGIIKDGKLIANGKIDKIKGDKSLESVFLELNNK